MPARAPIVSILLCTCNHAEQLRETLDAFRSIEVPGGLPTELVVVDNASRDHTPQVVRESELAAMEVRYVYEGTPGLGSARNAAMNAARGDILLWTDDDVRPPREWIAAMSAPLLEDRCQAVTSSVRMAPHLERPWMEPNHYDSLADTRYIDHDTNLVGASMGFVRRVRERVPLFDPELGAGALGCMEEVLYSAQLRRAGFQIKRLRDVTVSHHFDAARLKRRAWSSYMQRAARSLAYVDYHWNHRTLPKARLRRLYWALSLRLIALRTPSQDDDAVEGYPGRELWLRTKLATLDEYAKLQGTPRKYERHGLTKRR